MEKTLRCYFEFFQLPNCDFVFVSDVHGVCIPSETLSTQPRLPKNSLASGYVNFTVQACFNFTLYSHCSWKHGSFDEVFFNEITNCGPSTKPFDSYAIECFVNRNKTVTTSLILQDPIRMGNNDFTMTCNYKITRTPLNLSITVFVKSKRI